MSICVRGVQRDDAAELAAVHAASWLAAYRGLMSDEFLDDISVDQWRARWTQRLSGGQSPPVRVALRDGSIVGLCIIATPSRDEDTGDGVAEIVAMNVRPDSWRSGVGTVLMNDALERFRSDGWQVVLLWVVDGNARAERFYRRFGFDLDGASRTHEASGATEVRMRLALVAT